MRFVSGFLFAALLSIAADGPPLQQVHRVYLLPMGSGLDQYLANHITASGLFVVVTDPQKADAVLTENIGEGLQQKLDELYPPETAPKKAEKDESEPDPFAKPPQRLGGFSRGRGNLFLIDRTTRAVLWSIYRPVKSSRPDDTDQRAADIIRRLEKRIRGK